MTVTTARSVPEALKEMEKNRFDAIVSDYQMPGMDGIGFLKAVRAVNPFLPFILFTGKGMEEVVIEAFNSGTDFYLQKGSVSKVKFAELKDTIKKAVKDRAEKKEFRDSEIRYRRLFENARDGILILDAESGTITDANPLVLTLLGYTRDEILGKNIWDLGVIREKSLADQAAAELKKTGYIRYHDLPLKTKDGRDIAVEFVSNAYDAETLKVIQINIREIAERKRAEEALKESEKEFRSLAESMPQIVWVTRADGWNIYFNQQWVDYTGLTLEESYGHGWNTPFHPDDRQRAWDAWQRATQQNDTYSLECRLRRADGTYRWWLIRGVPQRNASGEILKWFGTCTDIEDIKRAEEKLKESEARLRFLVSSTPVTIYTSQASGDFGATFISENVRKILGYGPEDFTADPGFWKRNIHPDDISRVFDELPRLFDHDNPTHEYRFRHKDGTWRWVRDEIRLIRDADGSPHEIVGSWTDITEHKAADQVLAQSEERFRQVAGNAGEWIWETDEKGLYTYSSPVVEQMLGFTADDLVGKKYFFDLFAPDMREDLKRESLAAFGRREMFRNFINPNIHKNGSRVMLETSGAPVIDNDGHLLGYRGTDMDITERTLTADALKKSSTLLNEVCEVTHIGGWEIDVATKEVLWTRETYRIHEISEDEKFDLSRAILFYDLPGRSALEEALKRCMEKGEPFDLELPFTSAKGKPLWTRARGHAMYEGGTVVRLTGTFQDITERKAAEETMKTFSEDLDRKVLERTSNLDDVNSNLMTEIDIRLNAEKQLSKNLKEKEVLLREVHHRVKNNLQIIISLLNLQSRYITDETTLSAFRESQNRVRAMALVHEKLYRSTDLATIDLDNYIRFLGNNLLQFFGVKGKGISLTMDIHDIFLAIDTAIPFGLIINELISNSLKYAFPEGRKGEISIAIHRQDHTLTILYKDNGIGIPEDFDWRNAKSMGLQLVTTLVEQLDGTIELDRTDGTLFTMRVQEKEQHGSS